jgi:N-glycosylase/DNA lyase
MKAGPWSDWRPLAGWNPSPSVLAETLDGGQSFAWQGHGAVWTGRWADHLAQLRLQDGHLEWRAPGSTQEFDLRYYLAAGMEWPLLCDSLPWRSDAHLAAAMAEFRDLRILRQPFGETLLSFLCSATKQIVQIKQMTKLLSERHGVPLAAGLYRLPTWEELAGVSEADLRRCLLGFRARFIAETARFLARHPDWLNETEHLPYASAKARLVELPGVGEKVADCVLLFGAGRLEAFPVDTWVLKSLARRYGLVGWKPDQVAHFGRTHFGPLAGLAQQFLFAWERRHGGR